MLFKFKIMPSFGLDSLLTSLDISPSSRPQHKFVEVGVHSPSFLWQPASSSPPPQSLSIYLQVSSRRRRPPQSSSSSAAAAAMHSLPFSWCFLSRRERERERGRKKEIFSVGFVSHCQRGGGAERARSPRPEKRSSASKSGGGGACGQRCY